MVVVNGLIWDEWNRKHITQHGVTPDEVEEVCHGEHKTYKTYRKRVEIEGKTKTRRKIKIILSPESRNLKPYKSGIFYPITAFEKREKND